MTLQKTALSPQAARILTGAVIGGVAGGAGGRLLTKDPENRNRNTAIGTLTGALAGATGAHLTAPGAASTPSAGRINTRMPLGEGAASSGGGRAAPSGGGSPPPPRRPDPPPPFPRAPRQPDPPMTLSKELRALIDKPKTLAASTPDAPELSWGEAPLSPLDQQLFKRELNAMGHEAKATGNRELAQAAIRGSKPFGQEQIYRRAFGKYSEWQDAAVADVLAHYGLSSLLSA